MRIFLLIDCYLPNPISCAKLMADLATELNEFGHEVTVVTADHTLSGDIDIAKENEVTVVRVKTQKLKHPSRVLRAINEIRLSSVVWRAARKFFDTHPCDLVVCYSPTIFWSGLIEHLKNRNGCGTYLILRDIFPQWALDAGLLRRYGPAYLYFRHHELKLYRSANVIGVQSPTDMTYFPVTRPQPAAKVEVLFNWAKPADPPPASDMRRRLGLGDKVIFMYGGRMGVAQDMDNIIRLAENVRGDPIMYFLLVGDGSEFNRIRDRIRQQAMRNIAVHPAVPQSEYMSMLAECNVGLITLSRDLRTQNLTGKILGYMALAKPILASVNPGNDLSNILHESNAGLACDNGQDETLSQFALQLAHSPDLRETLGRNAYKLLTDKFSVSAAARQILAHFTLRAHDASTSSV